MPPLSGMPRPRRAGPRPIRSAQAPEGAGAGSGSRDGTPRIPKKPWRRVLARAAANGVSCLAWTAGSGGRSADRANGPEVPGRAVALHEEDPPLNPDSRPRKRNLLPRGYGDTPERVAHGPADESGSRRRGNLPTRSSEGLSASSPRGEPHVPRTVRSILELPVSDTAPRGPKVLRHRDRKLSLRRYRVPRTIIGPNCVTRKKKVNEDSNFLCIKIVLPHRTLTSYPQFCSQLGWSKQNSSERPQGLVGPVSGHTNLGQATRTALGARGVPTRARRRFRVALTCHLAPP